jgi:glycosyltransferase involved in cell wall biosynthesis
LRRASKIICVSDLTRKHANEQLDEGGLWRNEPETINSNEAVLERLGIERPFLLSAGSSMPHKNLPALIRAFALVARHIPHKLVIAGEPFSFSSDIFVALGCIGETRGRINVTGFIPREELLSLYRCADAFIFPSLFEGFGIPAVEAMESGCPVVSSNATSLPEVLGDAAEFFDPLSVESIAEAIKRVCLSKDLQNDLRQRGHERAKEFSWEKMARRTMEVYYSLA